MVILRGLVANPLSLNYNYIMKNKPIIKKVRSKTNSEIYYTWSNWETKEIDGVTFIPVVRNPPDGLKLQQTFYMRKENLEYVK